MRNIRERSRRVEIGDSWGDREGGGRSIVVVTTHISLYGQLAACSYWGLERAKGDYEQISLQEMRRKCSS